MKYLILLISALFIVTACSSKDKAEDAQTEATEAVDEAKDKAATMKEGETPTSEGLITCTNQKDVRTLDIQKTANGGCELMYTKYGTEKSVASSGISTKYCSEVSEKIQNNLSRSGFTCK